MGEVQAIGGVNEKIEGFFDICERLGHDSQQGVLIPYSNMKNLRLREDVIEACAAGTFRIYAIKPIDEALELLTGKIAGTRNREGKFPRNSLSDRIEKRLIKYAKKKV